MTEKEMLQMTSALIEVHQHILKYRWINAIFKPPYKGYYLCYLGGSAYDVLLFDGGEWIAYGDTYNDEVVAWKHIEPYDETD